MKKNFCIVIADFYPDITVMLEKGSTQKITESKNKKKLNITHDLVYVPGVFEIPVTIAKLINKYDAFVALGCVIKGETPHFDLISKAVVNAIMHLSVKNKKPIGNGIITCLSKQQAIERADPNKKNKGGEAAAAVLETLENF